MKTVLVFTCVILSAYALDKELVMKFMEKIQKIAPDCIAEVKASDSDLEDLMSRKFPPPTHEGKCLLNCIQRHLHVMNDDGTIGEGDEEDMKLMRENDEEFYNKLVSIHTTCKEKVKIDADSCETSTNLILCVKEESKKAGLTDGILDI